MGSSPKAPYYDIRQAEQQQDYMRDKAKNDLYLNYKSGLGGYTYDPSSGSINVDYTPTDQSRLLLLNSGVSGLELDPTEATDRYFNQAMTNIQPELDKYISRTSANLVNKGIPIGSQAYNEVMRQQDNNISNQIANLYSNARSQALSDTASQINNLTGLQSQVYQPQYIAGLGATGLQNLYTSQFQNEMDRYNAPIVPIVALVLALLEPTAALYLSISFWNCDVYKFCNPVAPRPAMYCGWYTWDCKPLMLLICEAVSDNAWDLALE